LSWVSCRLLAVYAAIRAIAHLPQTAAAVRYVLIAPAQAQFDAAWYTLAAGLAMVVWSCGVALLLWHPGRFLSLIVFRGLNAGRRANNDSSSAARVLGIALLGSFVLLSAVPELIASLVRYLTAIQNIKTQSGTANILDAPKLSPLVAAACQVVCGGLLVSMAGSLAGFVERCGAGTLSEENNAQGSDAGASL
jgi:hypothetical protein